MGATTMDEKNLLRSHGLKATPPRLELFRYLSSLSVPVTAEELYLALRDKGFDLSTLYRNLNAFVDAGIVKKEVGVKKENLYLFLRDEECHVLVCVRCGKKVVLEGCPYHEVNHALEKQTGFHVLDHNTEIYGICPSCLRKEDER